MNRVNPILNTNLWDNARAFANGLVANGHIVLLILVCLGAFIMSRGMLGLAEMIDSPEQTGQRQEIEETKVENTAKVNPEAADSAIAASDVRVEGHRRCTYTDYRQSNKEACDELQDHVDKATTP